MKFKNFLMIAAAAMWMLSACDKNSPANPSNGDGDGDNTEIPGGNDDGDGDKNEGGDDNQGGEVEFVQYTDILTWEMFKDVENRGHQYFNFTDLEGPMSDAIYAGNIKTLGDTAIQMRSKSEDSGIITTTSGGKRIAKIAFVWNMETDTGYSQLERKVELYGKSTAYTSAEDLYDSTLHGELLGSNIFDKENLESSITVEGDYPFIGIRSADGAIYFDRIEITWEAEKK